jgi:hypothetical protein
MTKKAPNEEAKLTALQCRRRILRMLESAIENRWDEIEEQCDEVRLLAKHCAEIEQSYRTYGVDV